MRLGLLTSLKGFVALPRIELGFGVSETHVLSIILQGCWTNLGKIN